MIQEIDKKDITPVAPLTKVVPQKRNIFSYIWHSLTIRFSKVAKKFDVDKISFDRLTVAQQKAVDIASVCIFNKNSKLYADHKDRRIL